MVLKSQSLSETTGVTDDTRSASLPPYAQNAKEMFTRLKTLLDVR